MKINYYIQERNNNLVVNERSFSSIENICQFVFENFTITDDECFDLIVNEENARKFIADRERFRSLSNKYYEISHENNPKYITAHSTESYYRIFMESEGAFLFDYSPVTASSRFLCSLLKDILYGNGYSAHIMRYEDPDDDFSGHLSFSF